MPEIEQRQLKARAFNVINGLVNGKLAVKQDYCALDVGSVIIVCEGPFIRIDGEDILSLYMGEHNLEISVNLYDKNDNLLLHIDHNEWISGDPSPWDIEADCKRLSLRERRHKICLSLDARTIPMQGKGELWRSGKFVKFEASGISIERDKVKISFEEHALVGAALACSSDSLQVGR